MKKKYLATFVVIICISCNDKSYPEKPDLNNHLLENSTLMFHFHSVKQLENMLSQDSTSFADIIKLRQSTSELIDFIDKVQDQMIEVSGGYNENGLYFNPKARIQIERLMIDEGLATQLKSQLDSYSETLSSYGLDKNQISIEPKKNLILKHDPRYQGFSSERLHFEDVNLIEAISVLQIYRSTILLSEGLTINLMLMKKCAF